MVFKGVFFLFIMDFKWAIEQLKAGEKVRRKSWDKDIYFFLNGTIQCNKGTAYFFPEHFDADDWGLYENLIIKIKKKPLCEQVEEIQLNRGDGFFKVVRADYIKDAFVEMEKAAIDVYPDGGEFLCVPLTIIKEIFGRDLI
jgi:hypothetical protein